MSREITFGERLSLLRERNGLKQSELGEMCGVTSQTVSTWERNKKSPTLEVVLSGLNKHPGMRAGAMWMFFGELYAQKDASEYTSTQEWNEAVYTNNTVKTTKDKSEELIEEIQDVLKKYTSTP